MIDNDNLDVKAYEIGGKTLINVTPYDTDFMLGANTKSQRIESLPPSGTKVSVLRQEPVDHEKDGTQFCKLQYVGTRGGDATIAEIKKQYPNAIIVGSLMAAQAYPGDVVALCPAEGYERVTASEKVYRLDKFIVY